MTDQFPEKFGKYKIIEEVGRGGFASVYKAVDTTLDRTVALKVLASHLLWDPTFVQRFQREATVAANLDHPNIVTIYEVSQVEGIYFIAMQFLEGRTVSQILEVEGPVPVSQMQAIIEQIASALDYAHARGFVHRDIKPSNIIVADDGQATLTDFGLVKAGEGTQLTATGMVFGTPEYMSPEQAEGKGLDARSDIYSLGVVLFAMLAGRAPFLADTTPAVMYKHVHEPPPLDELPSDLPQGVVAVIEKALAKDPASRFQTVAEMVEALRKAVAEAAKPAEVAPPLPPAVAVEEKPVEAAPLPEPEVAPSPLVEPVAVFEEEAVPFWRKLPLWGWGAIVGVVLLIALAGAFLAGRGTKPVPTPTVVAEVATPTVTSAAMPQPTATPVVPTFTPLLPTDTPVPPTATRAPVAVEATTPAATVAPTVAPVVGLFTDVSYWAGIGISGQRGVAWGDYDNDGYVDLFVTSYNVLYRNNGDGTFTDATAIAGGLWWGCEGVVWGDYDNDGDLDLYTSDWGSDDSLYRSEGDGTFTNVTDRAGLGDPGHGQSVAWGDYDGDGDLDLYVANSLGDPNYLFRNEGNGTFSDVTAQAQVADTGHSGGVAWGDYDNDGDPDLCVTNSPETNRLFQNQGDGTFVDRAAELGVTAEAYGGGKGVAWGDYDNDDDLDLAISSGGTAVLFRNDGDAFADVTISAGVGSAGIGGEGVAWGDYDNDGWLDFYVTSVEGAALYHNRGDGTFEDVTGEAGVDNDLSLGTAWGDYDNDGDLDLFVVRGAIPELGKPGLQDNILYRNNGNSNHWLHVKTVGTISNRAGIGARVRVIAGGFSQIREVSGGSGRTSQDSLPVEFGFGTYTGTVTVEVTWPNGTQQSLHNVTLNQILTVTETGA